MIELSDDIITRVKKMAGGTEEQREILELNIVPKDQLIFSNKQN